VPRQLDLRVHPPTEVERLRRKLRASWPAIYAARRNAHEKTERLREGLAGILPSDMSFVVFGSLARGEFTRKSDLDWTLLVDGAADPGHHETEIAVRRRLAALRFRSPGPAGTFGGLTMSHDLIHKIGGDDDTNRNTTQRILLLLESTPIGDSLRYASVVRNVLRRYIEEDVLSPEDSPYRVPRFLHNDVSRYWRTMAVDFAHKRRLRAGSGWALRTIKLRMSRKLMYAAGLLSCYSCSTDLAGERKDIDVKLQTARVVTHLEGLVRKTPLDIVAGVVLQYFGQLSVAARELFGAYDEFLALLNDPARRRHLDRLPAEGSDHDEVYRHAKGAATRFQDALTQMFFDSETPLPRLTRRYGVF
jgi:predicted nucleotidyltransferase